MIQNKLKIVGGIIKASVQASRFLDSIWSYKILSSIC